MCELTGAAELHCASRCTIISDLADTLGAVEAGEGEHLVRHELARFVRVHVFCENWCCERTGERGSKNDAGEHAGYSN
jgi:hypothetical protein